MKTLTTILLSFLVGCGGGTTREAYAGDFIPVRLYLVQHPDGLTGCQVQEAWAYAQAAFDKAGIPVKLVAFTEISDFPYSNFDDPRYQYNRLDAARKWLRQHEIDTAWSVNFFFLPPLICEGGMRCYGGIAERVCKPDGGVAIGQGGPWSSHTPPRDRIYSSGIVAAHEIGHLLGAWHHSGADVGDKDNYPPNVMDMAAGRFVDSLRGKLWFLAESSTEMSRCAPVAKKRAIRLCKKYLKNKPIKKRRCIKQAKKKAPVLRSGGVVDEGFYFY